MLLWTLGCRYLFKVVFFYFFRYFPRVEFLGSSIFSLLRNFLLFSIVAHQFHSDQQCKKFPFCPCPGQLFFFFFDDSHSDSCGVISQCGFDLHFSDQRFQASFHVPVGHLCDFFGKMSVQIFCPFFLCWVVWNIYIFWILTPYLSYTLQVFSPIL